MMGCITMRTSQKNAGAAASRAPRASAALVPRTLLARVAVLLRSAVGAPTNCAAEDELFKPGC